VSAKEGQSTGIFNSLVFHTNSAEDFGFAGISDTVSDVSMAMSVTVCAREEVGGGWCKLQNVELTYSMCGKHIL
jgi:hypothetical protein